MRLQHNIMAKSAYRSYKKNVSGMKKGLERLSSGYKINRAADDAAGLAISEKMRAQITGEETAQKNARDGISLVQTAEGALAEVHDMLDRMVELATQSANGTYDNDTDRLQLQKEMDQLLGEIDRIADSSNFNGLPLLDGSMDGGGDTVYAPSPAGSIELPDVGKTPGESTVLHTDSATDGNNVFSVGLHSIILNANSSISIAIGDNITITITNNSDEAVTAEDIAAAIAGDSSKDISVDFGDAKVGASEDGSVTVTLNGNSVFGLKASGSHLIFTQTGGSDIKMPQEVTITDATPPPPKVEGSGSITESQESDTSGPAKYTIDLRSIDMTAPGNVTIEIFGREFDLKISDAEYKGNRSVGELLAEKLTEALKAANLEPDENAGALSFTDNRDGTITLEFETPGAAPAEYDVTSVSVTTAVYQDGKTLTAEVEMKAGQPGSEVLYDTWATVEIDGETYEFNVYTQSLPSGVDPDDDNVVLVTHPGEFQDKIMEKLAKRLAKMNEENRANNKAYNEYVATNITIVPNGHGDGYMVQYEYIEKRYIGISEDGGGTGGSGGSDGTGENFSGYYDRATTVLQTKQTDANGRLASTVIELKPDMMANGAGITIGGKEYTFTTDKTDTDKIIANKDNLVYVGDLDLSTDEGLKTAIDRLTVVSEGNGVWSVGYGGEGGKVTLREKVTGGASYMDGASPEFDLRTLDGVKASLGWRAAAAEPKNGKAMTFQIGDTSDGYNQLQISIRDCRLKALGIDAISIATQADAAAAVYPIRLAIDYVSDVRGTLGAAQNRLDHTINNLSVMAENIQDAESTIRDADAAEEMMAYTKSNILIQSSQAMLSQANQTPQGVLQMLQ